MKGSQANLERVKLNRLSSPPEHSSIKDDLMDIDSLIGELEQELEILTQSISCSYAGPMRKVK